MHTKFLMATAVTAALTWSTAPATAQQTAERDSSHFGPPTFVGAPGSRRCDNGDRQHEGRDARFGCGGDGWAYVDSEWALYNNRSCDPDSYNDWWHDRPDRAFPR